MSPEQASGQVSDKRADIWSFGVVLFEMLTGRQVFAGETVSHVLAGVLAKEPQWNMLPINLHPRIRLLLERCLEKEAKDRYHDIADARVDIQKALADPNGPFVQPVAEVGQAPSRPTLRWIAVAAVLSASIVGLAVWNLRPSEQRPVTRLGIALEPGQYVPDSFLGQLQLAIAPNGDSVVFVSGDGTSTQLHLRMLDEFEATPIRGTAGATTPFFSPDGEWLGFFASGKLQKLSMRGGAPQVISAAPLDPVGAAWGPDGTIVFGAGVSRGLSVVSAEGNAPAEPLTIPAADESSHVWPAFMPGGRELLFTQSREPRREIALLSLETGDWKFIAPASGPARYVSTGHIVYSDSDDLWALPFDATELEVGGSPIPIQEGLYTGLFGGVEPFVPFAVSANGSLAFLSEVDQRGLVWVDRETGFADEERSKGLPVALYQRLSPGGDRLSVSRNKQIWIYDVDGGGSGRPLTNTPAGKFVPVWTPDGQRVTFGDYREPEPGLACGGWQR